MCQGNDVADFYALKTASLRVAVDLVEPAIEVRFRKHLIEPLGLPWYIAQSKDRRECLALFPNENADRASLDPNVDGYEVVLYVVRTPRQEQMKRLIVTQTRFRFVQWSERLKEFADTILESKLGPPPVS